jgi:hypothetical protein
MGFEAAAGGGSGGIRALTRRKQVDSDRARAAGGQQLAKELSVTQLIAIGTEFTSFFLSLVLELSMIFMRIGLRRKSTAFSVNFMF